MKHNKRIFQHKPNTPCTWTQKRHG